MLKADKTTHETYEAIPEGGPTATAQHLSRFPAWLEVSEKLGYDPLEWKTYGLPVADWDECRRRLEEREAEQAATRADYDAVLAFLVAAVRFAPGQVREALGLCDWEDYHA